MSASAPKLDDPSVGKAAKKQDEKRKHLQSFVDRFRASATKARQAQSRIKMLAKTGADRGGDWTTDVHAVLVAAGRQETRLAAGRAGGRFVVGYDGRTVLSRMSLSLAGRTTASG